MCVVIVLCDNYFLLYSVLGLETTLDVATIKESIDDILAVSKSYDSERANIALEFYFDCYCFCGKMAFSSRKTASFLSIMHEAFIRDSRSIYPAWTMAMSFEKLQAILFKHSVQRPPQRYSLTCADLLFLYIVYCLFHPIKCRDFWAGRCPKDIRFFGEQV